MTPLAPAGLLLALLVTAGWGLNFVVIKLSVAEVSPFLVVALRFVMAAFPAVLFVPRPQVPLRALTGFGLVVGVVQVAFLYLAIRLGVSPGLASVLMQLQAFFTALLASRVLRERITWNQWLGMGIAFTGMGAIGFFGSQHVNVAGLLLILAAAAGWAMSNVYIRVVRDVNVVSLVVWSSLIPPIPLALLAGAFEPWETLISDVTQGGPAFWIGMAFMAYFNTLFASIVWNALIQRHGASRVAPLSLLVPVFGLLTSGIYFREAFSVTELVGAALVFLGLLVHVLGGTLRRTARPSARPAASQGS